MEPGAASDAALSISEFYSRVKGALRETFPGEVWVTGEIRKVTVSRGIITWSLQTGSTAWTGLPPTVRLRLAVACLAT